MAAIRVKSVAEAQMYLQMTIDGDAEPVTEEKPKREQREMAYQIALFAKRKVLLSTYPPLTFLYASFNGIYIPPALLKQVSEAGLVKGVLDLRWDVQHVEALEAGEKWPVVWSGIAIDLKDYDGKPTPEQLVWAAQLCKIGIRAYFCAGDRAQGFTPLEDAWWTLCAFGGIVGADNFHATLTPTEERRLAEMQAQANLSRQQKRAEGEARKLERALKKAAAPPPVKTVRKAKKPAP